MAETARLDAALAARGLARSRTHAARLIADGLVSVDGVQAVKSSQQVLDSNAIEVAGADHYVSRAAHKLVAALDAFAIPVAGRTALDVGASTGGFTQVLCERGAARVIALDVGHGQLAAEVAADPRVTVVEGFNARELSPESLADAVGESLVPDLVVGDLSFISLTMVIPALVRTAPAGADLVLLVKPQFEVGRTGIREGIVRDPGLRADAVATVLWSAWDAGLGTAGIVSSPILGGAGNHEYLVHLSTLGSNPTEWLERVSELSR
ncbi:TlyA family RNA methyltransferase [Salinibacterium sp. dk2585]|uniref:TlyA family RNA methyltransferase n=1 Tax=unclassified Salinibacterium TaxID=2632331 RepID=UPI0011C24AF8|nr:MULTISPECIES: TlyA family RNA methyltransferase [unclassified Salinibacterium]QEE60981.1 TlyA family RNA methyltransferase [Salinibacterium sp. dk2585]TXK52922.1 TlyA family RNA methyltransferase [Salinibacterium sp. dk5596]